MPKGSKWAKLREQYPKMPMDAEYGERIEVVLNSQWNVGVDDNQAPLRALPFTEHVAIYNMLRERKEHLENQLTEANLFLEAVEQCIAGYYEVHDLLTQKFEDGTSITVAPDPVVTVSNEQEFYDWVKADEQRKADYKLREYIFPATAKSQTKALLENGSEPPPGVSVFYQNKFTRRGA